MNREGEWGAIGGDLDGQVERRVTKKIAILGHSMVRELPIAAGVPRGWNEDDFVIRRKFFLPGATVPSIQVGQVWDNFVSFRPDLTFLWIGGNDVTRDSAPVEIARGISELAQRIVQVTGGEVKVLSIERRPRPRGLCPFRYNRQRNAINRQLK